MSIDCYVWPLYINEPLIFSFDSDESYIIFEEWTLDDDQKEKDVNYEKLNSPFMMWVLSISKEDDHILLDNNFEKNQKDILWHIDIYEKIWLNPSRNIYFEKIKSFTPLALQIAKKFNIKYISPIGYSSIHKKYFNIDNILKISKKLNSKTEFPWFIEKYDLPSPKQKNCKLWEIKNHLKYLNFRKNPIYSKIDWLWWWNNVDLLKSENDIDDLIEYYWENKEAIIQEKINNKLEIISEYTISKNNIECTWHIWTIIYWNQWNWWIYTPQLRLTQEQDATLSKAALWLQKEWYQWEKPLFCGFDVFIDEKTISIVEINARWLWTWIGQILLKKLSIFWEKEAIAVFDYIKIEDFEKYKIFIQNNLYNKRGFNSFSVIPMWFSAYIENNWTLMVFLMIIWDFDIYYKKIKSTFWDNSFILLDKTKIAYKEWFKKLHSINKKRDVCN